MDNQTLAAMENYLSYSPWAYQFVSHVLTLGVAAMFAGLVYFLASSRQVSPKYRLSSYISAAVMASALLELGLQSQLWRDAFFQNPVDGRFALVSGALFANGYRYANWSIDVPALLTQLLVVLGVTGAAFWRYWAQFVIAGLAMIWTGYVGQYYQAVPTSEGLMATGPYWLWFVVSSLFFAWILVVVFRAVRSNITELPVGSRGMMKGITVLLLGSWLLYPVAYLCPAFAISEVSVVARQSLYTVADISSKVIYGILLGQVALARSAAEGFPNAVAQQQRDSHTAPTEAQQGQLEGAALAQTGAMKAPVSNPELAVPVR